MTTTTSEQTYGYAKDKEALVKRLHRIEGQVRGIARTLTDFLPSSRPQQVVSPCPLDEHVRQCVAGALSSGDEQDAHKKTEELLDAVQRFSRTR